MTQVSQHSEDGRGHGQLVHTLMHFLRVVRYRKKVVALCVIASMTLGAIYYLTATRYYESSAGIFVMQTGNDVLGSTRITPEGRGSV